MAWFIIFSVQKNIPYLYLLHTGSTRKDDLFPNDTDCTHLECKLAAEPHQPHMDNKCKSTV